MTEQEILNELEKVFQTVFENNSITITPLTNNNDIDGWNSLNHAILITEAEKKFNISFDIEDMLNMHTVEDIVLKISEKK